MAAGCDDLSVVPTGDDDLDTSRLAGMFKNAWLDIALGAFGPLFNLLDAFAVLG